MTWDNINEMIESGMSIGSHGHTHISFNHLNKNNTIKEFKKSKKLIYEKTNINCKMFAFPYGSKFDVSKTSLKIAKSLNFDNCFTNTFGFNYFNSNEFTLNRIAVTNSNFINHL